MSFIKYSMDPTNTRITQIDSNRNNLLLGARDLPYDLFHQDLRAARPAVPAVSPARPHAEPQRDDARAEGQVQRRDVAVPAVEALVRGRQPGAAHQP